MTLPYDPQHTNPVPDRQKVQTARQAAEALFGPKRQAPPAEAPTMPVASPPPSTEPDAPRTPRILSATPVTSVPADKPEARSNSAVTPRRTDTRRKAQKIPTSAHGRIKALTTYGMTVDDVADLYGVPVSDIAHIVSPQRFEPIVSREGHG
jgi:hypothetical protein